MRWLARLLSAVVLGAAAIFSVFLVGMRTGSPAVRLRLEQDIIINIPMCDT